MLKNKQKKNQGHNNWYGILWTMALDAGLPNLFDTVDGEQEAIDQLHEVLKRIEERGGLPNRRSKDPQERKDATWFNTKKQAKIGKGNGVWYNELEDIAKQYGYSNIFDIVDKRQRAISIAHEVFKRIQDRGSLPKSHSKNVQERKDSNWINNKRQAKIGKGSGTWYDELKDIAKEYGYPNIFGVVSVKQKAIDKAHEFFGRAKDRDSLPKHRSEDPQEVKDAGWICKRKQSKLGGKGTWYPELDEIAKQYGFPHAFDKQR